MNSSSNLTHHLNLTFSFRTSFSHGTLIQAIYFDAATDVQPVFSVEITDGYLSVQLDGTILHQFYQMRINDTLWHDISISIDYTHHYLLLRLDDVFSHILYLASRITAEKLLGVVSGDEFRGCIGNLTFNHQDAFVQEDDEQQKNDHLFVEEVRTTVGCSATDTSEVAMGNDDFCSRYRPCYNGGSCINLGSSFICHCFQSRFTGQQCQYDLQPCESYPCSIHERCRTLSADENRTFVCLRSSVESESVSLRNPLYLGLLVTLVTCVLSILIAYCHTKRKDQSSYNSPSLTQKSSSSSSTTSHPVQILLKLNYNGQPTIKTMKVRRKDPVRLSEEEHQADACEDFVPPSANDSFIHYRSWEGRSASFLE